MNTLANIKQLGTVAEIRARVQQGRGPEKRPQVNTHVHIPPNFSAFSSVAEVIARVPVFLDGYAALANQRDEAFMLHWARIMTGVLPKRELLRPELAVPLLQETVRQLKLSELPSQLLARLGVGAPSEPSTTDELR